MNVKLAELLSKNGGTLPYVVTKDAFPVYYVTRQGVVLCPYCANLIIEGKSAPFKSKLIADDLEDVRINWDNYNLECERGHKIESATIEIDIPVKEGVNYYENKREIPNKIRQFKLHHTGE